jgi:hypothetical protein
MRNSWYLLDFSARHAGALKYKRTDIIHMRINIVNDK